MAPSQRLISISKLELDTPFQSQYRYSTTYVYGSEPVFIWWAEIYGSDAYKRRPFISVLLAPWTTTIMTFSMPDKTSASPVFDEKHIQESSSPLEMHATNPVVSSAEFVLEVSFHDVVRSLNPFQSTSKQTSSKLTTTRSKKPHNTSVQTLI